MTAAQRLDNAIHVRMETDTREAAFYVDTFGGAQSIAYLLQDWSIRFPLWWESLSEETHRHYLTRMALMPRGCDFPITQRWADMAGDTSALLMVRCEEMARRAVAQLERAGRG